MKLLSYIACFLVCSVITPAQAGPTINEFMELNESNAYFNCAYKGKKASKKCLATHSYIKSSAHPTLKKFYGPNETLKVISIKWPDNDISRYAYVDSMDMVNLNDKRSSGYRLRDKDDDINGWHIDLSRGLFIDKVPSNSDHIRLW